MDFLNNYGILLLIFIFVIANLYYKNLLNILILIFLYLALKSFMEDKNALFVAYILTIIYGIYNNFHLLENFQAEAKIEKPITEHKLIKKINNIIDNELTDEEDIKLNHVKNMILKNLNKKKNNQKIDNQKINNQKINDQNRNNKNINKETDNKNRNKEIEIKNLKTNVPEVDSIISEELLNEFIERAKANDSVNVSRRSLNIYELKPIISKIKKKKVINISKSFLDNEKCKPIIISNDKFIIDGHHRWFAKKNLVENNTHGYNQSNDIYNENINVVIIDYPIKKLISKLKEYKIKYNNKYLSSSLFNLEKVKNSEKEIKELKAKLLSLEDNYNKLNSIDLE
jgi:hypothetical protein